MLTASPDYAPTPVVNLHDLGKRSGVKLVALKHEGFRVPIGSFKLLGPAYALARAAEGRDPSKLVAVAATSGNHGRAVALVARRLGAKSLIFMSEHVSPGRVAAIEGFGARVVRVAGGFDTALGAAIIAARAPDHVLIADLAVGGDDRIARDTIAGYGMVASEFMIQEPTVSHVFVGAGSGALAAGIAARVAQLRGATAPMVITVEPETSDTVRRSLAAGQAVAAPDDARSVMDGLVVGHVSSTAWPILAEHLDAALAIDDARAIATLRDAARGAYGPKLEIGETGIAALAGMVAVLEDARARAALRIGPSSRLLAIACEGVTDRAVFDRLVAS